MMFVIFLKFEFLGNVNNDKGLHCPFSIPKMYTSLYLHFMFSCYSLFCKPASRKQCEKAYVIDYLPKPISVDKVIFHQMCSNKQTHSYIFSHDFFTTYVKELIFTKHEHRQINYLQEIFQNGRQKRISFFF